MGEIQTFNNEEFGTVRTVEINNEPWFVGKDVAEILRYADPNKAIAMHVDEEDKLNDKTASSLGQRGGWLINESGLYSLILRSQLESAKRFKRWVTSEVLPQIRKTGGYNMPGSYAEALERLLNEVKAKEQLALENETFKAEREILIPKAEFFDSVTDSKTAISIRDVAKVLDMGYGQNKLFEKLREERILMPDNRPYQKYIDAGYFRVVEQKYEVRGETRINIKTLVFQKGIDFIRKRLSKEN